MDEPTNGLDIPGKRQFREFITQGLTPDRLFVVSTHQVKDVESILDQILLIDRSEIIRNVKAEEIVEEQTADGTITNGEIDLETYFEKAMAGKEVHND